MILGLYSINVIKELTMILKDLAILSKWREHYIVIIIKSILIVLLD